MKFDPQNFLQLLKMIVPGANSSLNEYPGTGNQGTIFTSLANDGGYRRDDEFPLGAVSLISGTTLVTSNGFQQLSTASGTSPAVGVFGFPIPRDYDEASDNFFIRALVASGVNDASVSLTFTATITTNGTIGSALTAVAGRAPFAATSATPFLPTTKYNVVEFNLSGNGLTRDSVIGGTLSYAGTTTGANKISFLEKSYDSTLVSYNVSDTTGVDGSLSEEGNPLR